MARLEECELSKLRHYSKEADLYPACWLNLLDSKQECVDTFSKETATCDNVWDDVWGYYYEDNSGSNYFKRQNVD